MPFLYMHVGMHGRLYGHARQKKNYACIAKRARAFFLERLDGAWWPHGAWAWTGAVGTAHQKKRAWRTKQEARVIGLVV